MTDELERGPAPGAGGDHPPARSAAGDAATKWDRYFADLPELTTVPAATSDAPIEEPVAGVDAETEPADAGDPAPLRPRLLFPAAELEREAAEEGAPPEPTLAPIVRPAFASVPPPPSGTSSRWERMFADLSELAAPAPEAPPAERVASVEEQHDPADAPAPDFPVQLHPPTELPANSWRDPEPVEQPAPVEAVEGGRVLAFERTAATVGARAEHEELGAPPPPAWVVALKDRSDDPQPGVAWRNVLGDQPQWRVASAAGGAASMTYPGIARPRAAGGIASRWHALVRGAVEALEVLALALLMFVAVRSIAQNFVVDGGSMEPTFANGEMLIVNKLAYRTFNVSWLPWTDETHWQPFGKPRAGDVVVFKFPQNPSRDFIKRVIATPGQTVQVRSGVMMIDNVPVQEPYLSQPVAYEFGPITVPEGSLFVLGDNRNNSYDSHSWGTLENHYLIGRAELRYWPFGRTGRIDHTAASETPGTSPGAAQSLSTPR